MDFPFRPEWIEDLVEVDAGRVRLKGNLALLPSAHEIILFAHGSGSGRHSPRNRYVAEILHKAGLATLLIDLLTAEEAGDDAQTAHLRFHIELLSQRLVDTTDWLVRSRDTAHLAIGYFGASTGAAAALVAAAQRPDLIHAIVSRGGRPDLAGAALTRVQAPTLLIVGGADLPVIELNWQALEQLGAPQKQLIVIPGATHLFQEPGALEEVARLTANWFRHMRGDLVTAPKSEV